MEVLHNQCTQAPKSEGDPHQKFTLKLRFSSANFKRIKYEKLLRCLKTMTTTSFILSKSVKSNFALVHFFTSHDSDQFFQDVNGKYVNSDRVELHPWEKRDTALMSTQSAGHSSRLCYAPPSPLIGPIHKLCERNLEPLLSSTLNQFHKCSSSFSSPSSCISKKVTPLSSYSYPIQLLLKENYLKTCIKRITRGVFRSIPHSSPSTVILRDNTSKETLATHQVHSEQLDTNTLWCSPNTSKSSLGCPVHPILASPNLVQYRNKCEFTVGYSNEIPSCENVQVGFVHHVVNYNPIIASCSGLIHVPYCMQEVCHEFKLLIQKKLIRFPVYCRRTHTGCWRLLMVRCNADTRRLMVIVQVGPTQDDSTPHTSLGTTDGPLQEISHYLIKYLIYTGEKEEGAKTRKFYDHHTIQSLYIQQRSGFSDSLDPSDPLQLVYGDPYLMYKVLNCSFHVAPLSFFQTNSKATEVLYAKVIEMACTNNSDVILDICCGVGSIGICLYDSLRKKNFTGRIIGLEICQSAVEDARMNATMNQASNIEFILGKAQDMMPDVIKQIPSDTLITAIIDPPRCGLSSKLLASMMHHENIRSIIYISCNPESLIQDAIKLCSPSLCNPFPFQPVECQPLDLFPHTYHCETILRFERPI